MVTIEDDENGQPASVEATAEQHVEQPIEQPAAVAPVEEPAPEASTPHSSMVQALKNEFGDQMAEVESIAHRIIAWLEKAGHEISGAL